MILYYLIFLLLSILTLYEIYGVSKYVIIKLFKRTIRLQKIYVTYFFISICAIIMSGFRWETGTDWDNYLRMFNDMNEYGFKNFYTYFKGSYGIGYTFILGIICELTNSYSICLFVFSCIIISLTYTTIYSYSVYPIASIWFLYSISFGYMFAVPRQGVAIAICIFSIKFICRKKVFKFVLCILLATSFHNTAIFFVLAYYAFYLQTNYKKIVFIVSSMIIINLVFYKLIDILITMKILSQNINDKIYSYMSINSYVLNDSVDNLVKIITRGFIVVLIFVYLYKRRKTDFFINGVINLYFLSIIVYILSSGVSTVFQRIAYYYEDASQYFIIALSFKYEKKNRIILYFITAIYLLAKLSARLTLGYKEYFIQYRTIFQFIH